MIKVDHATVSQNKGIFERVSGRVLIAFALPEEREAVITRHGWPGTR